MAASQSGIGRGTHLAQHDTVGLEGRHTTYNHSYVAITWEGSSPGSEPLLSVRYINAAVSAIYLAAELLNKATSHLPVVSQVYFQLPATPATPLEPHLGLKLNTGALRGMVGRC